jgi:hypothetical protein
VASPSGFTLQSPLFAKTYNWSSQIALLEMILLEYKKPVAGRHSAGAGATGSGLQDARENKMQNSAPKNRYRIEVNFEMEAFNK